MSILRASLQLIPCPPPSPPAPTSLTDFAVTLLLILAIIYFTVHFAIGVCRYFIRLRLDRREEELTQEKVAAAMAALMQVPLVLFSAATTKLAWSEAVCSICLIEFTEGDVLRVLPACGHGFHTQCVERWLASNWSCPNCRRCVCDDGVRRRCSPDEALPV